MARPGERAVLDRFVRGGLSLRLAAEILGITQATLTRLTEAAQEDAGKYPTDSFARERALLAELEDRFDAEVGDG